MHSCGLPQQFEAFGQDAELSLDSMRGHNEAKFVANFAQAGETWASTRESEVPLLNLC
jgi:hypothetical protein